MRNALLFAVGWTLALFASLEVIRTWIARDKARREPFLFAADSEPLQKAEKALRIASRSDINAASAEERVDDLEAQNRTAAEMHAKQLEIQRKFVDLARKRVDSVRAAADSGNMRVRQKIEDIQGKIKALENAKISKNEFEKLAAKISDDIAETQIAASGRDTAFMAAMNKALDAEDIQQYKVIQDIEKMYATKSEGAELEKKLNALANLSRKTTAALDTNTEKIIGKLQELQSIDKALADFEERNMRRPDGSTAGLGLVDQLLAIKRGVGEKLEKLEKTADALVRCEAQTDLRDRVANYETELKRARQECEDSRKTCEKALGQDPLVMKPDSHLLLGKTGKSLVLQDRALKICDAPGEDGFADNCRVLDASVGA